MLITQTEATYSVEDGQSFSLELSHHGEPFTLTTQASVTLPIEPARPLTDRPVQPAGRAPTEALSQN